MPKRARVRPLHLNILTVHYSHVLLACMQHFRDVLDEQMPAQKRCSI